MNVMFRDRVEAGQLLAKRLPVFARRDDVLVLAVPRGGVPIGFTVAGELQAPLDILMMQKLDVSGCEDLILSAIAANGVQMLDPHVIRPDQFLPPEIDAAASRERHQLEQRCVMYRGERPPSNLREMIVVLVDDGMLTGATMSLAIRLVQIETPRSIVVAVPAASRESLALLSQLADDVVTLARPEKLDSIAECYGDFAPTSDDEIVALLTRAAVRFSRQASATPELICLPVDASAYPSQPHPSGT
jgi:putative phosphoribosyl transferase